MLEKEENLIILFHAKNPLKLQQAKSKMRLIKTRHWKEQFIRR